MHCTTLLATGFFFFFLLNKQIIWGQNQDLMIIAHRGGVVDSLHAENSLEGLEEAIRRGYTHVEVDARMTLDGHVVCYHNNNLRKEGIANSIASMTLSEIKAIKLSHSQEAIPTFEEYCQRCAGRIAIMVDIKGCKKSQIKTYCDQIETALSKHNLLDDALILINQFTLNNQVPIAKAFLNKIKISWRKSLALAQKKAKKDTAFGSKYYVFNHGNDFNKKSVQAFQKLGLKVIVSVNLGHFIKNKQSKGLQSIQKNRAFGVDGFQIDACYDSALILKKNKKQSSKIPSNH